MNALTALRREQRDDVVAGSDERHARPDPLDDSSPLVPEHARRVPRRVRTRRRVQIGVADAASGEPDEHLAVLRLCEVDLLDDERLAELLEDCGADLHARSLAPAGRRRVSEIPSARQTCGSCAVRGLRAGGPN